MVWQSNIALFFNIASIEFNALIPLGRKRWRSCKIEARILTLQPRRYIYLNVSVTWKSTFPQVLFQMSEQEVVTWSQVGTVRWTVHFLKATFFNSSLNFLCVVNWSIVVQQHHKSIIADDISNSVTWPVTKYWASWYSAAVMYLI